MANAITQSLSLVSANAKSKPFSPSVDAEKASLACEGSCSSLHFQRRIVVWGLAGAVLGLNLGDENAWAGKRNVVAPTEEKEKKDPNVTGVLAKVLASKRRKEAMKEAMAKQREKGKAVDK